MDTVFSRLIGFWETAQCLVENNGHISHVEKDISQRQLQSILCKF